MFFHGHNIYTDDFTLGGINLDWNSIINQGFAVGSQAIAAWGKNPSTQVATNQQGIFAIQPTYGGGTYLGTGYGPSAAALQAASAASAAPRGGVGLDDAAGSVMGFIQRNPLLVGGVVLGAFLLFRDPPKRR